MTSKKARERIHLNLFKELNSEFPGQTIIDHESPDFLIPIANGKTIGIEIIDYIRGQNSSGSIMRETESLRKRLISNSQTEFEKTDKTPLEVLFHFYPGKRLDSRDFPGLSKEITNFVSKSIPEKEKGWVQITLNRRNTPQNSKFHNWIAWIRIFRHASSEPSFWSNSDSGWIDTGKTEIHQIIQGKESKITSYRKNCDEIWLLIIADGKEMSSIVALEDEVKNGGFQTQFEKVFFLDRLQKKYHTLKG